MYVSRAILYCMRYETGSQWRCFRCEAWSELLLVRACFGYAVAGLCFWQRCHKGMHLHIYIYIVYLYLSIANAVISNTSLIVDLGVTFDQDLKFKSHICNIVKKAKQRACLIHRCFISRSIPNLIRAFKTYVRPLLEYAPQIWSPHQSCLIAMVEGVQRTFTKRLPGFSNKTYLERLLLLQLQSLEHRRLISDLVTCYNIVHQLTALSFTDFFTFSNAPTRGHPFKLIVPVAKNDTQKYFFSSRIVPIWNSLPLKIVSASNTKQFKALLLSHDFNLFLTQPTFTPPHPCILNRF